MADNNKLITGKAGTGKTTLVKKLVEDDPDYGILASTTGIAAVNLGTTTLNSLLRYFDTKSLRDKLIDGSLQASVARLAKSYRNVIIDEVSMMEGEQLDVLMSAVDQVNERETTKHPLGIVLVGDFGQLPPVRSKENPNAKWAFEAECWDEKFEGNVEFLTKVWRQDNLEFVAALELARDGRGHELAEYLTKLGVGWNTEVDDSFKGTTIFAKNDQVDNYNALKMRDLVGNKIFSKKEVKGLALGEWNKIPQVLELKRGAYVMILVNKSLGYVDGLSVGFEYSNGDCGTIEEYNESSQCFKVKLARNGNVVEIPRAVRLNERKQKPDPTEDLGNDPNFEYYYDDMRKRYIVGECWFHPLRAAWGVTCHKSQGLTLDKVQVDIRNHFFSQPNMTYVALSRARTLEGLRIVGLEKTLGLRCKADPKVVKWLEKHKQEEEQDKIMAEAVHDTLEVIEDAQAEETT